jgi:hypothetical protein
MPAKGNPVAEQSEVHLFGAMSAPEPAKNPSVREAESVQHPWYVRPAVVDGVGAAEEEETVDEDELEEAELEETELELTVEDAELLVRPEVDETPPPLPDTVKTDRRQLPPHWTAGSPAHGMLHSESGAWVPKLSEDPQ